MNRTEHFRLPALRK